MIRDTEVFVWRADEMLHADCTEPHSEAPRRRVGLWAAFGSGGQMAMGDVQRDTPT